MAWTVESEATNDAGASCAVSGSGTTRAVQCSDDGSYTLKLRATDPSGGSATSTTSLVNTNAALTVTIVTSADGAIVDLGRSVRFGATFSDPGSNDRWTCRVDWGDGTTSSRVVTSGRCDTTHVWTRVDSVLVTVTIVDDDAGEGRAETVLIVSSPTAKVTGGWTLVNGQRTTDNGYGSVS